MSFKSDRLEIGFSICYVLYRSLYMLMCVSIGLSICKLKFSIYTCIFMSICTSACMFLSICLSIHAHVCFYPSVCLYMRMYVSIHLSVYTCACMFLSICLSIHAHVCFYPSVCLYMRMYFSIHLSVYTCACIFLSICLSIHAYVWFYPSICLYMRICLYPSVCLYMRMYVSISQCHETCFTKSHSKATSEDSNEFVIRAISVRPKYYIILCSSKILYNSLFVQIIFKHINVCVSIILREIGSGRVIMVLIA